MTRSLRDNPLTPDLTAEQLRTRRGFAAAVAEGLARTGPSYPHGTEPWHPGEPDDHLVGFATKEDRDAYQRHAPGPFERVRRATPPAREDLRRYAEEAARYHSVDVEMLAVKYRRGLVPQWRDLDPKPPPQDDEDDREWAMFRHARDEIRRYLDSEPHRGAVWLLEDAVARREPPLLGERYDAFKDRAADLLAAAGWRVGYPVTDVPRLLAIAAERGRGAR
mgnify:CR=1 FL=1